MVGVPPGKLFRLTVLPTGNKNVESKVPYINRKIRSTCGCPIDERTLMLTEPTGKPTNVALLQVWICDAVTNVDINLSFFGVVFLFTCWVHCKRNAKLYSSYLFC